MTLLGPRIVEPDFDHQVAEYPVRGAVPNGHPALGIPITKLVRQVCPGTGAARLSADNCVGTPGATALSADSHDPAIADGTLTGNLLTPAKNWG